MTRLCLDIMDTEVPGKKAFMPWAPSYESNGCKLAELGLDRDSVPGSTAI